MPEETSLPAAVADFIIVGSGSAGAVLADRLSADGRSTVLLIEEGGGDSWLSRMPKGFGKLISDPGHAHFYPSNPDDRAHGPQEIWVRGKMLGGSSAINGMVWNRGVAEDYDRIAAMGNPGWSWADMLPCLRALEDHHLGESEFRGRGGPVSISTNPNRTRLADAFIQAGTALQLRIKEDQNGPELEGVGYAQWNINASGRRISSARALLDAARKRPNLQIETGTRVDRLLIEDGQAKGVVCSRSGEVATFSARREVILCAGAIASPKILQLSGIGDGNVLRDAGVETRVHSPNVGRRMREHLTLALNFRLRDWQDSDNREYGGYRLLRNVLNYAIRGKGPMARGAAEAIAFVRAHPLSDRPDTQIMFNPYSLDSSTAGLAFEQAPGMQCYSYMLRPESEGSALLASPDSPAPMVIRPAYLEAEIDQATSIAGTRAMRRIVEQDALKPFVVEETDNTRWAQSDEDILALYKLKGHSGYHAVGTAAMGPAADDVVDSRLRVRGIGNLRIVDCSIFREVPSGNTNAPTMAAAWRLAAMIREDAH